LVADTHRFVVNVAVFAELQHKWGQIWCGRLVVVARTR
jgi:hypothetical protein